MTNKWGIHESWWNFIASEFQADYMQSILGGLTTTTVPHPDRMFSALQTSYDDVKVVIIGQDPYPRSGMANGMAFAVDPAYPTIPKSLQNIFKEIEHDIGEVKTDQSLKWWASQGVFLLNRYLTTEVNEINAHEDFGWDRFTDHIIELLNLKEHPVVFLLWGQKAQQVMELIDEYHYILTAAHPSPRSANRGFLGCRHFSKTNGLLEYHGLPPISW